MGEPVSCRGLQAEGDRQTRTSGAKPALCRQEYGGSGVSESYAEARKTGRLAGRVVIVTGAGQGIGKVYALGLAAAGARLALCDLRDPVDVAAQIEAAGGEALSRAADITSPQAVAAFVAATVERYGTVHALVNNAAMFTVLTPRPFYEIDSAEWDKVMQVNTRGTFEVTKAVVPFMRAQRYGKIVNIASGTLFKGSPGMLHYVASKGAVVAMTRVMARELGEDNIGVNCVAPGFTESEMASEHAKRSGPTVQSRCFKRPETPEDLVGAIVFMCSSESDFITGQTLLVDGGSVLH
jgi:NAD(P)-dependent dehydrogenase (short-subunit alcohol dehydrogenase family)